MTVSRSTGLLGVLVILACSTTSVFAEETEVLFDGASISDWDTARDQARLAAEFSRSELTAMANPPALRWRFVPKATLFNDIFLRKPVARPFSAIRFQLRNQGETCILAAKAGDARGAEWTTNRREFPRGDEWRWVEFPAEQWKLASWSAVSGDHITFPLSYVTLIAVNVRSGAEYEVQVSRVEAVRPDRPVAVVHHLAIPPQLVHGQSYAVNLRVELDKPCTTSGAWLVFHRGRAEAFRQPVPLTTPLDQWPSGQTLELKQFPLSIPEYAFGGPHAVTLELGEAKVLWNGRTMNDEPCSVSIEARIPGRTTAALRNHHGSPTLFINGQPHNGMAYMAYVPSVPVFRDFAGAGVDLFSFSATPTEAGYGLSKTAWTAPDEYDFSQLDQRVMMVLEANPQAFFFPRLYLHAPSGGACNTRTTSCRWTLATAGQSRWSMQVTSPPRVGLLRLGARTPLKACATGRSRGIISVCRPLHRLPHRVRHHRGMDDVGSQRKSLGRLLAGQRSRLSRVAAGEVWHSAAA